MYYMNYGVWYINDMKIHEIQNVCAIEKDRKNNFM